MSNPNPYKELLKELRTTQQWLTEEREDANFWMHRFLKTNQEKNDLKKQLEKMEASSIFWCNRAVTLAMEIVELRDKKKTPERNVFTNPRNGDSFTYDGVIRLIKKDMSGKFRAYLDNGFILNQRLEYYENMRKVSPERIVMNPVKTSL